MNKDFQDFDSIYESAARCLAAGIRPSFNIIFAFPGEGRAERQRNRQLHHGRVPQVSRRRILDQYLHALSRRADYGAAPQKLALRCPTSFEGWADFFPRYTKLPWLNGHDHQRLQVMRDYLRIAFDRIPIAADRRSRFTRTGAEMHFASGTLAPRP